MAAIAPFGLRMQPDLKDRVEKAAKTNNRSMNAEIVYRLEQALDWDSYIPSVNAHPDDDTLINVEGLNRLERMQVEAFIRFLLSDKGK